MLKINVLALVLEAALWAVSFSSCTSAISEQADSRNHQEAFELSVMSYNIHHANPPSSPKVIDLEAIARVIEEQQPQLVALQEVDVLTVRSGKVDQAKALAERLDMNYYFAKAISFEGGEYGVAILSRFPISETQTCSLPMQPDSGGEPRVLASAKVELPGGIFIRFANTHLDALGTDENRLLQIEKIAEISSKDELPMIIAGDFNAPPGSAVINVLDQSFSRSCNPCAPTIPVIEPERAIDFIAYRPSEAFTVKSHQVLPETYASDHLPVVSVFRMP